MNDAAKETFFDRLLLILNTIEGIPLPPADSLAYRLLKQEAHNLFFFHAFVSRLTEAEVQTAIRMNADKELPRTDHYNTISRRFLSGVMDEYIRAKSIVLQKLLEDNELNRPKQLPVSDADKFKALEDLLMLQWEDFKIGKLNTWYIYPELVDVIVARMRAVNVNLANDNLPLMPGCHMRLKMLENTANNQVDFAYIEKLRKNFFTENRIPNEEYANVVACAKRQWVIDLFEDLKRYNLDLKTILYAA